MSILKKILYVSNLCSPRLLEYIFASSSIKPGLQVQKFHRLIVEGLSVQEDHPFALDVLSTIPVIPKSHKKRIWNINKEVVGNIYYRYVPMLNVRFFKSISVFVCSFVKIFLWDLNGKRNSKVVYCDVLNLSLALSAQLACKLTGTKIVGVVTDIPGMIVRNTLHNKTLETIMHDSLRLKILSKYDGYVFLTEQMNELINHHHKPYIVIEGMVDIKMKESENKIENKDSTKIIVYAGGIFEEYGVRKLIEAFIKISGVDLRLYIYGSGEMEKDMPLYMSKDTRIVYQGNVANSIVIQKQLEATLLINPRPSNSEFTKYSFPSKNMEYMVSGTPLVTTPLPGMPEEYKQFVYLFDDETIDGICTTIKILLSKSKDELHNFGYDAKQFVLNYKNNHIQAQRILQLLERIN